MLAHNIIMVYKRMGKKRTQTDQKNNRVLENNTIALNLPQDTLQTHKSG